MLRRIWREWIFDWPIWRQYLIAGLVGGAVGLAYLLIAHLLGS